MRINNLEFKKCSYIDKEPEHPSYEIVLYIPNCYYGNEYKYIDKGIYYQDPNNEYIKISKENFANPEYCFQLLSFKYTYSSYEVHFCGDRPIRYKENYDLSTLFYLIEYGNKFLNYEEH